MIGRLLDGPDAPLRIGQQRSGSAFEDLARGLAVPAFALAEAESWPIDAGPVDRSFAARNKVAIVGYAQSPVRRTRTRRWACWPSRRHDGRSPMPDSRVAQVDGFVTASLFPTAGAHAVEDGVSIVSANWLAEHLGVDPGYAAGFQGIGQIPGSVSMAVNAVASGAARDYVVLHRALHNPQGRYHGNPMREPEVSSSGPCRRASSDRWR